MKSRADFLGINDSVQIMSNHHAQGSWDERYSYMIRACLIVGLDFKVSHSVDTCQVINILNNLCSSEVGMCRFFWKKSKEQNSGIPVLHRMYSTFYIKHIFNHTLNIVSKHGVCIIQKTLIC